MNRYREVVAIYHFMDQLGLEENIYPYYEGVTPLRDWCDLKGQYPYNIYLDIESRNELKAMLQDARGEKFTKVIVINEGVLGALDKEIIYIISELASYGVTVEVINRNKENCKSIL